MTVDSDLIELIRLNPGITVGEIEHTNRFRHLAMGKQAQMPVSLRGE